MGADLKLGSITDRSDDQRQSPAAVAVEWRVAIDAAVNQGAA